MLTSILQGRSLLFDLIDDMIAGHISDIRNLHRMCEGHWRSSTFTSLTVSDVLPIMICLLFLLNLLNC